MADINFGLKLSADGSAYVGTVKLAREETDKLINSAGQGREAVEKLGKSGAAAAVDLRGIGLTLGVGVAIVAGWAKSVVGAAADLNDLSQMTGSTVESLSRLQNQFQVSGKGPEVLNTALQRLTYNLNGTDEESGKAQKRLAQLGITAKDPAQAMEQLAQVLENYKDGAGKAAAVQDILGKGSQALIPVLHDLASAGSTHATVTKEQADQAEALQKAMAKISVESTYLKEAFLNNVVPPINEAIDRFKVAKELYGGGFSGTLFALNAAFAGGATFYGDELKRANKELEEARRQTIDLTALGGGLVSKSQEEIGIIERKVALLRQEIQLRAQSLISVTNNDARDFQAGFPMSDPRKAIKDLGGGGRTDRSTPEIDAYLHAIQQLDKLEVDANLDMEQLFSTEKITRAEKALRELQASPVWAAMSATSREVATDEAERIKGIEQQTAALKTQAAQWVELAKAAGAYASDRAKTFEKDNEASAATVDSTLALAQSIEFETKLVGWSSDARERAIILKGLDSQKDKILAVDQDAYALAVGRVTAAIDEQQQKQRDTAALEQAKAAWKDTYDQISGGISDSLISAFEDGKNAGKHLVDELKRMFDSLVLRPVVQSVVAPYASALTGALGVGTVAAATGYGMNDRGLGGLGSAASTVGGAYSLAGSSLLPAAFTGAAGAGFSAGAATLGTAATSGLAAAGGTAAVLGSAAAVAIPIIGWAVAAYALYQSLASDRGGPKLGGSFDSGGVLGANRFFTPADADKDLATRGAALQSGYASNLAALGGSGSAQFALGYDRDPEGTASSRVSSAATVNGRSVYFSRDQDVGRDDNVLTARLATEANRVLLAALQASDLPEDVAAILNSVIASTGTDDAIQGIIARAELYKSIGDYADVGDEALKAYATSQQSLTTTLADQRSALLDLADT